MLRIERQAGVVIWTIDRAETRNALDYETIAELTNAVHEAAGDGHLRAGVLTGAGHVFVSGGDLRELRGKNTPQDGERLSDVGYELCRAVMELPFPVVCALPGPAVGAGAELAVACDLRVADVRAKISFKQARMGVTTGWGTVPRLIALVGTSTAARLLYTTHEMTAAEAKLCRLVDEVTENGLARTTALAWASDIALASPHAVAQMKRLVREATEPPTHMRALERQLFVDAWSSADHDEAVAAYFERRPPVWGDR